MDELGRKSDRVAREFLLGAGLIDAHVGPSDGAAGSLVIGGKNFTEQEILGEMMAILIESHSNLRVERKLNLSGTVVCFTGLKSGDLDIYVEYVGTALMNILQREVVVDPDEAYYTVKQVFRDKYGLTWLKPLGFNNTYTLTMRREHAEKLGIETISDLAGLVNSRRP